MNTFTESGLTFNFTENWKILRFDQHRFYQYLSGYGLKGVDFIAIDLAANQLWIMEVKNFAPAKWKGESPTLQSVLSSPEVYATEMIAKFNDSIRLLKIINDYYRNRWKYRLFIPFFKRLLSFDIISKFDFLFWPITYQIILQNPEQVSLCLFIEWPNHISDEQINTFNSILAKKIEQQYTDQAFQFSIVSTEKAPTGLNIVPEQDFTV